MYDVDPNTLIPIMHALDAEFGPPRYLRNHDETACLGLREGENSVQYAERCAHNDTPYVSYKMCAKAFGLVDLGIESYAEMHKHWRAVRYITEWVSDSFSGVTETSEICEAVQSVVRNLLISGGLTESEFATL